MFKRINIKLYALQQGLWVHNSTYNIWVQYCPCIWVQYCPFSWCAPFQSIRWKNLWLQAQQSLLKGGASKWPALAPFSRQLATIQQWRSLLPAHDQSYDSDKISALQSRTVMSWYSPRWIAPCTIWQHYANVHPRTSGEAIDGFTHKFHQWMPGQDKEHQPLALYPLKLMCAIEKVCWITKFWAPCKSLIGIFCIFADSELIPSTTQPISMLSH